MAADAFLVQQSPSSTTLLHMNNKKKAPKKKDAAPASKGFAGALKEFQRNAFPYAGSIRPGNQSPQRVVVEEGIVKPDYANDGVVGTCVIVYSHDYDDSSQYLTHLS
jgi:hypothetical protein